MQVCNQLALAGFEAPRLERRPVTFGYLGVLAVWGALFLVNPKLALEVFRQRRYDSPIPRLEWAD